MPHGRVVVFIANAPLTLSRTVPGDPMSIYLEPPDVLGHMFNACTTEQINEFAPQKRGFRIHGHSTTIRLEAAFWHVLDEMARDSRMEMPGLIEMIHDHCLVANDKNLASCLRVICLKYTESTLEQDA